MHALLPSLHSVVGVRQKEIWSKLCSPLISQPASVSSSLPWQAANTAGTDPNQAARSPCNLTSSECSIHLYAQFGCGASTCIMVVSDQPVAPSTGITEATGTSLNCKKLTWNGQELLAATPSLVKSSIW